MRFVAGVRALLAVVAGLALMGPLPAWWHREGPVPLTALSWLYLSWSGWLMWKTMHGWPRAASKLWLWLDAAVLLLVVQAAPAAAPLVGAVLVLPVVALALLGGATHGIALALVCAATMLGLAGWYRNTGALPPWPVSIPIVLLALGPAAALLVHPSRELRQRMRLLDRFHDSADPRQGLNHHVDALLGQLAVQLDLKQALISLQGLEPRIFLWQVGGGARTLADAELASWRQRLAALPHDRYVIGSFAGHQASVLAFNAQTGAKRPLDDAVRDALRVFSPQALALPLTSYGQPLGLLCLSRAQRAFQPKDLWWLDALMLEALPLLERSDLLEQLQRETAARERERIGRDLHDSAVQPYLGLKYGLEALARRTRTDNPVWPEVQQLSEMASAELQTLRDVVSGLRSGQEPSQMSAPLAALHRQAERFEALYGLRVHIFAPQAPQLRGSAAKAMLHMVNEALTNVRRHTSATAVTVLVDANPEYVLLRLRNDHGPGEQLPPDFVPRSLTERATEFGGSVSVTHEQHFTEVAITLPLLGTIG